MEEPSKIKKIITKLALLLFLVVLPLGSWLFLNSGANVYRGYMADLKDYGKMPTFDNKNVDGEKISQDKYAKALTIVGFRNEDDEEENTIGMMRYVYDQFTENAGVLFLTVNTSVRDTSFDFNSYANQYGIDINKWSYINDEDYHNGFKEKERGEVSEQFALIDTSMTVRNYYSQDTTMVNRMITTMSLIMPRPPKAEIIFEPEKEK